MNMSKKMKVLSGIVTMAATIFIASGPAFSAPSALKGKIVVDGSSTVYPITEAAAAAFRKDFPNVDITVAVSGTGGGFKRFAKGETDISDASRPIKPDELKEAMANGIQFIELPIALDGLSVVLNPGNTWVKQLTVEDLKAIYLEKGKARTWKDLNPAWPDKTIKVYSPGTDSGTFDYFKEVVVAKGESFRPDMSTSEDDNVLVTGVAGDKYSIGYFGASYYFENKKKIKAAPIVNPLTGKAVMPDPKNVINGSYAPLSRPLFIYVNTQSLRKPEVKKFVEFYIKNSAKFATQVDYVAVSKDIAERASQFYKKKITGTTYVTPDFKKRESNLSEAYKEKNVFDKK